MILTSTMEASFQQFASCFAKPSLQTFCVIITGWLLGHGRRVVTHILLAGDGLKVKTFSCYHRFFCHACWEAGAIGRVMLDYVERLLRQESSEQETIIDRRRRAAAISG